MSRPTAVLAELDELTTRLRDGADAYARRVRWVEQTWRDGGRTKNSRARQPGQASASVEHGSALAVDSGSGWDGRCPTPGLLSADPRTALRVGP